MHIWDAKKEIVLKMIKTNESWKLYYKESQKSWQPTYIENSGILKSKERI